MKPNEKIVEIEFVLEAMGLEIGQMFDADFVSYVRHPESREVMIIEITKGNVRRRISISEIVDNLNDRYEPFWDDIGVSDETYAGFKVRVYIPDYDKIPLESVEKLSKRLDFEIFG